MDLNQLLGQIICLLSLEVYHIKYLVKKHSVVIDLHIELYGESTRGQEYINRMKKKRSDIFCDKGESIMAVDIFVDARFMFWNCPGCSTGLRAGVNTCRKRHTYMNLNRSLGQIVFSLAEFLRDNDVCYVGVTECQKMKLLPYPLTYFMLSNYVLIDFREAFSANYVLIILGEDPSKEMRTCCVDSNSTDIVEILLLIDHKFDRTRFLCSLVLEATGNELCFLPRSVGRPKCVVRNEGMAATRIGMA